jgi:NADH-quinone oxidoreductase subunit A
MQYFNNLYTNQYLIIFICISFSLFLGFIIFLLSYTLAVQNPDSEKISAYECGFEPFEDARNKFDVRFYIVAILFIIFDVEVIYLFPWSISLYVIGFQGFWVMILFLIILTVGFLYEIVKKALDWQ